MTGKSTKTAGQRPRPDKGDAVLSPTVFQPYVQHLAQLLNASAMEGAVAKQAELAAALNGQPSRELRKLYTIDCLRNTGTYFTGSALANRLITPLKTILPNVKQIVDPACGAGDLLVACARHLPLKTDVIKTLEDWGQRLAGFDINYAFVEATRYRLALLALERSRSPADIFLKDLPLNVFFPYIRSCSGMEDWRLRANPSLIVVNPPFSYGEAVKGCTWGGGRVSQAASFIDNCLRNAGEDTRLLAILPDVLRTGTRYERWRRMVAEKARISSVRIAGQFDEVTEISVFLLELENCKPQNTQHVSWACLSLSAKRRVKDLFDVRVGPVVPFRLDGGGSWYPYAHSKTLLPWQTVRALNEHTRFKGTTYRPPFVAIRRTSKADYQIRCIGTIVTGKKPIAIENHLLVVMPRDKKVSTCKKLLKLLKEDSTSRWMNERIRCRHLTVSSITDLPWPED